MHQNINKDFKTFIPKYIGIIINLKKMFCFIPELYGERFKCFRFKSSYYERGLRILNIGTGREVVNFYKLGASKIFHFDLSELAIAAISNYIQKNNIKNIIYNRKKRYMYFGRFISDRVHRFGIYAWYN